MRFKIILPGILALILSTGVFAERPPVPPASVDILLEAQSKAAGQVMPEEVNATEASNLHSPWPATWQEYHADAYLAWAKETETEFRWRIGFRVMFFLLLFFFMAHALKRSFWKDIDRKNGFRCSLTR